MGFVGGGVLVLLVVFVVLVMIYRLKRGLDFLVCFFGRVVGRFRVGVRVRRSGDINYAEWNVWLGEGREGNNRVIERSRDLRI